MRYRKPDGVGSLKLYVPETGESLDVADGQILEGAQYEQFVAHGLLARVREPKAPAAAPAPVAATPTPSEAPVAAEEPQPTVESDESAKPKVVERKRRG